MRACGQGAKHRARQSRSRIHLLVGGGVGAGSGFWKLDVETQLQGLAGGGGRRAAGGDDGGNMDLVTISQVGLGQEKEDSQQEWSGGLR